jgi:DNA-binding MarR family transcriptional regulator
MKSDATGSIVLLTRLARIVYRRSTEELLGIKLKELAILAYLREHDDAGTPASQQSLMEALCVDANTCVLLLNELETAQMVERRRDATDRRRHVVHITDDGRAALHGAEHAQTGIEDDVLVALTSKERATLHTLLEKALGSHGH